jgi:hypothetical protein
MATDTMLHLFMGIVIGQLTTSCTDSFLLGIPAALAAAIVVSLIKELLNVNDTSYFWNMSATTIGGAIGSGMTATCILYGA